MYLHTLKERGQIFEQAMALPQVAIHDCPTALNVGNELGMLSCTITANTAVAIAAGKIVTFSFMHSDSQDGTYTEQGRTTITTATALSASPGRVVARAVFPPDTKRWIKMRVACDDAAASGSVDVFVEYLAR